MVYIEIIYMILYSVGLYFVLDRIYKKKINDIETQVMDTLDVQLRAYKGSVNKRFDAAKKEVSKEVSKETKQYLSTLSEDVSNKLEELSNNVKNRRII